MRIRDAKIKSALFIIYTVTYLLLPASPAARAQGAGARLPQTPLGKIAREWLGLINGGTEADIRRFVEANFSPDALRAAGADEYVRLFLKLQKQSGGLELVSVTPPGKDTPMELVARTRRGRLYARITTGLEETSGKLAGLGVDRTEAPGASRRVAWPARRLSEPEMISAVKAYVARRAAAGLFSGVVLVARDDEVLLHVAHGLADRSARTPVRPGTTFHLASVGKMFTSVAIAQLVRDGKLSYDDTVAKLLPDYPNRQVAEKVTVHQLLTHTSGLGTFFYSPGHDPKRRYRDAWDEFNAFKDEPLFFEPGARWRYSNAGFSILGAVVERASGKDYLTYLRENIFRPLGMDSTDLNTPERIAPNTSILYTQAPDDPLGVEPYAPQHAISSSRPTGFGDGHSNAADLFKFARAIRTGRLLGEELTRRHVEGRVEEGGGSDRRWGYGFIERTVNGQTVRGHGGGGRTDVQMLWESGYTVIVQTNTVPPPVYDLSEEIINFITKQAAGRATAAGSAAPARGTPNR